MKPIGIFYATREGHTAHIAERIADDLRRRGFDVDLECLTRWERRRDLSQYAAAIVAGSVHAGRHEAAMVGFVERNLEELQDMPSAFFSVTLSEAGAERTDTTPEQHDRFVEEVRTVLDQFFAETGWRPDHVQPVAGALLYSKYNPLVRFLMQRIARQVGASTDTSRDHVYTDWVALDRFVDHLADELLLHVAV